MTDLSFIYNRKSIRDYKEGMIPKEDIVKMLEAATYAPSPKHQQNWHFVVLSNPAKINEIVEAVTESHTYIASLLPTEEEKNKYMTLLPYYTNFRNSSCTILVYSKEYDMIEEKVLRANHISEEIIDVIKSPQSAAQGIGAAVENLMLAATAMGYGTCYMTGPAHAKTKIEEIVGLDQPEYTLMAMVSLGIPAENTPSQPRRKPLDKVVTFIN